MERIASGIVRHRGAVVAVTLLLCLVCAVMLFGVSVNYSLVDYLPQDAESTVSLRVMQGEFDEAVPNARAMIRDVTVTEALYDKEEIAALPGVTEVMWLDDVVDVKAPLEMADRDTVEAYYIDGNALFNVTIADSLEVDATRAFYDIYGDRGAITGDAVTTASGQMMTTNESLGAMLILVPIIILILIITSNSWLEPALFLSAIGVAIVLNMGTNLFLGEISNITMSISPILQMAVSLDYAIFLLHRFEQQLEKTEDVGLAMERAVVMSFPAIASSAATTLFGFLALMFMRFEIGPDLGLNLAKGIVFSYLSVMVFMPALTVCCYRWIKKLRHRRFIPELNKLGKRFLNLRYVTLFLVLLLIIPAFLGQNSVGFIYGMGDPEEDSRLGRDTQAIDDTFGHSVAMVVLVPKGDVARERELGDALGEIDRVTGVVSYAASVGTAIPDGFLDESITSSFYSAHYARIILYLDTPSEGDLAFQTVERVRETTGLYYDEYYSLGQSTNLYDIKEVVTSDSLRVNLIAIFAIALVLLLTFRSLALPVILVFVIEAAIWINLSVPYFTGKSISYIGYLVINTVQLGATIDYAILMTESFMGRRRAMGKWAAMEKTLNKNFMSVLTSAFILSVAGFCLAFTSSNNMVAEMGLLLCRGTILSFLLVMCVLPCLLLVLDPVVGRLTLKSNFYKEGEIDEHKDTKASV